MKLLVPLALMAAGWLFARLVPPFRRLAPKDDWSDEVHIDPKAYEVFREDGL